jgi:hypothetical protein
MKTVESALAMRIITRISMKWVLGMCEALGRGNPKDLLRARG